MRPLLLLLASTAALWSCAPAPTGPPGDVLLVSVDTLRPDHLGIYGYPRATSPNLDRWFAGGAVYHRAYSTEANTSPSVVSLLSGLHPKDHGVRLFYQLVAEDAVLLPDLLPEAYQTAAFVSNIVLTNEALGIAGRFDHYDDFVDEGIPALKVFERNARRTTDAALAWLRSERDPDRPLFLWVHYIDPHGPYRPPPEWARGFTHEGTHMVRKERVRRAGLTEEPTAHPRGLRDALVYIDRYDDEIAFADAQIGRLLDGYAEFASIDEALIVFTADHGESMMEHAIWFTHGYHVFDEIVRVPLLLRGPGVAAGPYKGLVSGIDVLPTILGFVGVERPASLPGVDLRARDPVSDDRVVFVEGGQNRTLRASLQGDDKWVLEVSRKDGSVLAKRRYDLGDDPEELRPLPWSDAAEGSRRLMAYQRSDPHPSGVPARFRRGIRINAPKVAPRANEEQLEKLRALGYVE